jgi:hypothetical protein
MHGRWVCGRNALDRGRVLAKTCRWVGVVVLSNGQSRLAVAAVCGRAWPGLASDEVGRGDAREVNAIAGSSEERIRGVADVLTEASGQAQGYEQADAQTHEEAQWLIRANATCVSRERRLRSIGTPRSVAEIAAYLRTALPVVRRHHARFAKTKAPATFEARVRDVRRLFAAQERTLARTLTAARRHDSSAVLARVDELRRLARRHNAILVRLGLIDCTLPSGGFPL